MKNVAFTLVMMPPHTPVRRDWAERVAQEEIGVRVLQPETVGRRYATSPMPTPPSGPSRPRCWPRRAACAGCRRPQIAPPAGFYYPELVAHPVVVTNFREIFNDHIGAHIMAFVLAFARGLHYYLPQQLRREYVPPASDTGVVHLPESTALILGVGGIGSEAARLCHAFGMRVIGIDGRRTDLAPGSGRASQLPSTSTRFSPAPTSSS